MKTNSTSDSPAIVTLDFDTIECDIENAPKFWGWINKRGGLAHWKCADLSTPGKSWTTPALAKDGTPTAKGHWSMCDSPAYVVTDPCNVVVRQYREVKRFHVGIERGSGFSFRCTYAATKRIDREMAKAGENAIYSFDYSAQDCVIMVPSQSLTLAHWASQNPEQAQAGLDAETL